MKKATLVLQRSSADLSGHPSAGWAGLIFPCLLFTACCLLFLSPASASAYTYQDVQDFLEANPAPSGCVNWLEEVTTEAGSGYRVWKRCNASGVRKQVKYWARDDGSSFTSYMNAYLCDGRIFYLLESVYLEEGGDYAFSATAIKKGKESSISQFVLNS